VEIPHIFHQTWKTPDIPAEWQECVQSWRAHHPQWQYTLWTDEDNRKFIQEHFPEFLGFYDSYSYNIQRADAIRYFVLYTYGGVYVDLDFECLQPIDHLLADNAFVAGYEPSPHTKWRGENSMICNAFMASTPGHRLLAAILQSLKTFNPKITLHTEVLKTTGPLMLTQAVQRYPFDDLALLDDHILYPVTSERERLQALLHAPDQRRALKEACVKLGAYAIHYWACTWGKDIAGSLSNPDPFAAQGYTFFPGKDSNGYDSKNAGRAIPDLAAECHSQRHAWGFNTDGFVKYYLRPQSKWIAMENPNGNEGLYVKNTYVRHCIDKQRMVLFYNTLWDQPLDYPEAEIPDGYVLTTDRRLLPEAAAVVFHLPSLRITRHLKKRPGQLWVAWSMECEANYPPFLSSRGFLKLFDLTMTYHLDADVVLPYFRREFQEALSAPAPEKIPGKQVNAFISSGLNASGRVDYLRELMRYLDVHSYGNTLNNRSLEHDTGRQSKLDTIAQYQFTLAFENAVAPDYVTEKFYDPLLAGSVPVYLGAPNIETFAPGDHCFINVAEFADPRSLAGHLRAVSQDEDQYQQYLAWKSRPLRPAFVRLLEQQTKHVFARLCEKIESRLSAR
jgi:hypothetical protein